MEPHSPASGIRLPVVLRFLDRAADALAQAREEIDTLNVYPVPDGDTGTNMYLTVAAARESAAALEQGAEPVGTPATQIARGALMAARGNSGVILSQMLVALLHRIEQADPEERYASVMAEAMRAATDASYAAVGHPVEGTMLTVARAASDAAAAQAARPDTRTRDVVVAAAAAAREALQHTPEQLDVLARAGVVDAGGRGITVILDSLEAVVTGRRRSGRETLVEPVPIPPAHGAREHHHGPGGAPAYEVMYLLDTEDAAIPVLRSQLDTLGDSLVVVGGDGLWNVHIHVDDVGAAIEAGIAVGRPHRIRVTHFAETAGEYAEQESEQGAQGERRIVAVAAGPGLAALFEDAGAVVVPGDPGRRPAMGELLEAIVDAGAREVVVLPNDPDSVRAAELAARTAEADAGIRVAVIPTKAQVQGIAALAVHDPQRGFEADVLEMTATARHVVRGAVTVAARRAITTAGTCEPGDVLGVIGGDFAIIGDDLATVAIEVLGRLLGGGGELVTLVSGEEDADGRLAGACRDWLAQVHPTVEVVVYDGGQERYPLLMSVE